MVFPMHKSRGDASRPADPALFALLIGISNYETNAFPSLHSAVPDALAYKKYLMDDLQVPSNQIHTLLDRQASRAAIIAAFVALSEDERIKEGDPIFIFYAGHGSEVDAPPGWEAGGSKSQVQVLVPQDYSEKYPLEVPGIYDRTIGALLERIAEKKGNNITVVFDCCHSASGTRAPNSKSATRFRSVFLKSFIHTEDLDRHIWEHSLKVLDPSPPVRYSGLHSHILIAACRSSELAIESLKNGAFSAAFLKLLRSVPPDQLRYSEILTKMDRLSHDQNPQIEGANQHRYLFDAKVHPPPLPRYTLRYEDKINSTVIYAGAAHGITKGTEFVILDQDSNAEIPLATLRIAKAMSFLSVLEATSNISPSVFVNLVAVQTTAGEQAPLRLYIPPDRNYLASSRFLQQCSRDSLHFIVINGPDFAHLEFSVEDSEALFQLKDKRSTQHGYNYQFPSIDADVNKVSAFLKTASQYFWELDRASDDSKLMNDIQISFYKLQASGRKFHKLARAELSPVGKDLCENNVVDVVVEEGSSFGIKLTNNGPRDLYPIVSYFDNMDLTRTTYYEPPSSGPYILDVPLRKKGGSLAIGYGSGGVPPLNYCIEEGRNLTVGFLKLYVFTRPLDPSSKHPPCPSMLNETWGTVLMPIIQRRPTRKPRPLNFLPTFQASTLVGARINPRPHLVHPRRSNSLPVSSLFFESPSGDPI